MHLVIVDDLAADQERLARLLRQDFARRRQNLDLSLFSSGEEFLACCPPQSCDALFLDILLGGLNGIEVARKVRQAAPRLPIIITTTEQGYAVDGFEVHAMDYLVKPVTPERLAWCLGRLCSCLAASSSIPLSETLQRGHSATVDIPLDDILYGQYFDHTMTVHTRSGVYRTRASFQGFIAQLPRSGRFCVCGRGLVVNLSQVKQVTDDVLLLKNNERLPFSQRRKRELKKAYADWVFQQARDGV